MDALLPLVLAALAALAFAAGRQRALASVDGAARYLHSRPVHYGSFVALWCAIPALLLWVALFLTAGPITSWQLDRELAGEVGLERGERAEILRDARRLAVGDFFDPESDEPIHIAARRYQALSAEASRLRLALAVALALAGLVWARQHIRPGLRARQAVERAVNGGLAACAFLAIAVTAGIVLSLLFESLRFFSLVSPVEFLFGLQWSPQTALRADQVGSSGAFGAVPVFAGTILITAIGMAVAVPIGLLAAIYLAEYASPWVRAWVKPMLEILAGVPTVVYGFFAALTVAPLVRSAGEAVGLSVASESALAAGVVMGVMIIPFVSSLSDDAIAAVPQAMREGSLGLGATQSETIRLVILPAALPGIVGAVLLAISRAIGETMIVVMAAGLAANLTPNPLEAVTTVTVQIVTLLVGDQEFDSAKTLAAFALGLVLFFVTLTLNVIALNVVRRYREKYD